MSLLGRYRQRPFDRRKRGIDFTDFLEDDETVTDIEDIIVAPETTPPFVVSNAIIDPDGKQIAYYAGGGVNGETYTVDIRTVTSLAQQREDQIEFDIEEE